jgi:16S rRNA (cytosine1402-N4)-methyltransferase
VKFHTPVLLQSTISFLDPKPGDLFIDATVGGGGHTFELLRHGAKVLGIDRDPEAIGHLKKEIRNLDLVQENFTKIGEIARSQGFNQVKGILFDLGVSSHQLEDAMRGFSFQKEGPLDMRMDPTLTVRAYDIINNFDQRRLNEIFKTYAGEKYSWPISKAICSARQIKPIETTGQLAKIVEDTKRKRGVRLLDRIHPATRTFLALRIIVNSELLNLEEALPQTVELLKVGGRLVVISFHSLEDGIVKRFFKQEAKLLVLTKKPIGPNHQEILENPRARSAKLRVAERIC